MDSLVDPPLWPNNNQRTRALELARVLRDFGGYNQFHWQLTSGISNLPLRQRIAQKFPDYPKFYSKKGLFSSIIIPGTDVKFDVPHFNAALSRYLDCGVCVLPEDWASWAGDMFTFADRLDSTFSKSNIGLDSIQNFANSTLGSPKVPISTFKNNFADEDFYADIDSRNISTLIHHGQSYHDALDNYYNYQLYGRFGHFIDSYGGWKNFEKHVNSFDFFPMTPYVNAIFVEARKAGFPKQNPRRLPE